MWEATIMVILANQDEKPSDSELFSSVKRLLSEALTDLRFSGQLMQCYEMEEPFGLVVLVMEELGRSASMGTAKNRIPSMFKRRKM